MEITRAAGAIGIPGLYVTDDAGAEGKGQPTGQPHACAWLSLGKVTLLHTGQTRC